MLTLAVDADPRQRLGLIGQPQIGDDPPLKHPVQLDRVQLDQQVAEGILLRRTTGEPHPMPDVHRQIVKPLDQPFVAASHTQQTANNRRQHGGKRMTSSPCGKHHTKTAARVDQKLATNTSTSPRREPVP